MEPILQGRALDPFLAKPRQLYSQVVYACGVWLIPPRIEKWLAAHTNSNKKWLMLHQKSEKMQNPNTWLILHTNSGKSSDFDIVQTLRKMVESTYCTQSPPQYSFNAIYHWCMRLHVHA